MPKSSRRTPPQRQPAKKRRAQPEPQRRTAPLHAREATVGPASASTEAGAPLMSAARPAHSATSGRAGGGHGSARDPLLTKELQRIAILGGAVAVAMVILTALVR